MLNIEKCLGSPLGRKPRPTPLVIPDDAITEDVTAVIRSSFHVTSSGTISMRGSPSCRWTSANYISFYSSVGDNADAHFMDCTFPSSPGGRTLCPQDDEPHSVSNGFRSDKFCAFSTECAPASSLLLQPSDRNPLVHCEECGSPAHLVPASSSAPFPIGPQVSTPKSMHVSHSAGVESAWPSDGAFAGCEGSLRPCNRSIEATAGPIDRFLPSEMDMLSDLKSKCTASAVWPCGGQQLSQAGSAETSAAAAGQRAPAGQVDSEEDNTQSLTSTAQLQEQRTAAFHLHASALRAGLRQTALLSAGPGGCVKRALYEPTGETFALKEIMMESRDARAECERLGVDHAATRELHIAMQACHPNVVRCVAAYEEECSVVMVLEHMAGGSLAALLRDIGPLSEGYARCITEQDFPLMTYATPVGTALQQATTTFCPPTTFHPTNPVIHGMVYLHQDLQVVHRDLKPSNILLSADGQTAKICDFGVSRQLPNSLSTVHCWIGTACYMSPERINGQEYSFNCDVWSLGLTLLECVTGSFPYQIPPNSCLLDVLSTILLDPVPQVPSHLSADLRGFIEWCLLKDPRHRPSSHDLLDHPFLRRSSPPRSFVLDPSQSLFRKTRTTEA